MNRNRLVRDLSDILNNKGVRFVDHVTREGIKEALLEMITGLDDIDVLLNTESEINIRTTSSGRAVPCKPFTYRTTVIRLSNSEPEMEIEIKVSSNKVTKLSKLLKSREKKIINQGKKNGNH